MVKIWQQIQFYFKNRIITITVLILIAVIITGYLYKQIFYTILPGEAGVRWCRFAGGTQIDHIYPEGMHIIAPYDKFYIYTTRFQELHPELFALTKTGLRVHFYLSIRYAPKYKLLGLLHQKIGPDYPNKVIIPEIENVLREIIGTMEAEKIYTTGRKVIIEAINKAIERVAQRYINVDSVLIRRIELPDSVAQAIRYKIEQKHLVDAHAYKVQKEMKEAVRKRIEGEGIRDQLDVIASALPEGTILKWLGIKATLELSKSDNSKVVVIGSGDNGLPIIGNIPMENINIPVPSNTVNAEEPQATGAEDAVN